MQSNNKGNNESPFAAVRKFIECVEPSQGINASDVSEGVIATSKMVEATNIKSDLKKDQGNNQISSLSPRRGSNNSNWRSIQDLISIPNGGQQFEDPAKDLKKVSFEAPYP